MTTARISGQLPTVRANDSIYFDATPPFHAGAPHALDRQSLRRVVDAMNWLRRVAHCERDAPFSVRVLDDGDIAILVHPHIVGDTGLLVAIVQRYVHLLEEEPLRPGFVVVLPGLPRAAGHTVERAAHQLTPIAAAAGLVIRAAGPGLRDFAQVGRRGAPVTLLTVSRTQRDAPPS